MNDIVIPLDNSAITEAVLPHAAALATLLDAPIRLLSVVEPEPRGLTGRSERVAAKREAATAARLAERQAAVEVWLREAGLEVSSQVVTGPVVDIILEAGAAPETALIAMTTTGEGGLERAGIGSVADKVMRLAACPTLLVRPPYAPVPRRRLALRHLLVPLDGSPLAAVALEQAVELALAAGAMLSLVRVEPWRSAGLATLGGGDHPALAAAEAEAELEASTYLEEVCSRLPDGMEVRAAVLRGRAAESISGYALHEHVDLTVMTSHGRGGLRRAILGSVADRVIRSGVATLLIRPTGDD